MEHFKRALADNVRVVSSLLSTHIMTRLVEEKRTPLHVSPRWIQARYLWRNGMLEPWLESKGLKDANQVLAYFAVSKLGETPIDGKTDTNPEGLTAAFGKWASAVATRFKLHENSTSFGHLDSNSGIHRGEPHTSPHTKAASAAAMPLDVAGFV